jgi:error-prone DNA polymerase
MAAPAGIVGGEDGGQATQLALPLELAAAPRLRRLGRWQRLIADYSTSGVTVGEHALAILRPRLQVPRLATSAQLARLPTAYEVAVAGLVIARQRPGTAGGTMFLLFEDEFGTINLIVPRRVYERHRLLARAEPLLLARGRLERYQERPAPLAWGARPSAAGGQPEQIRPLINVIVRELASLERYIAGEQDAAAGGARVHRIAAPGGEPAPAPAEREPLGEQVAASMRAAAPAVQSFAAGRRR